MFKSARPVMPLSHIGFRFELLFFCCYFFATTFVLVAACYYLPVNTGVRLAINAVTASLWSLVDAQRIRRSASMLSEARRSQPVAALIFSFMMMVIYIT